MEPGRGARASRARSVGWRACTNPPPPELLWLHRPLISSNLFKNPTRFKTSKYVFVTGGVTSSLGKGITTASIGRILKSRGVPVSIHKLDPYINIDPGTMSPYQHGEVFVTDDGAETDLDLGHYERFIDENLSQASNVTTGRIYQSVIAQGAPRRLPGGHGPGDPPHHQRDQGAHRRVRRRTGRRGRA